MSYLPAIATRAITVEVPTAAITRFAPPVSALAGETLSIPIQIQNTGAVDIFESIVFLYDADTGAQLFRGYNAPLNVGEIVDYMATVTMPNKNLNLLLELEITPTPMAPSELVDSRTATVTLTVPIETALTISAPASVGVDETFTVSGILTRVDTGAGIPSQTINVSYNGVTIGSLVTGTDGSYSISATIPTAGAYTLKAEFPGAPAAGLAPTLADLGLRVGLPAEIPWLAIIVIIASVGGAAYLINESNVLGG